MAAAVGGGGSGAAYAFLIRAKTRTTTRRKRLAEKERKNYLREKAATAAVSTRQKERSKLHNMVCIFKQGKRLKKEMTLVLFTQFILLNCVATCAQPEVVCVVLCADAAVFLDSFVLLP